MSKGLVWHTCRLFRDGKFWRLEDYYMKKNRIPIVTSKKGMRICTKDFKIVPINRVIRTLGHDAGNPAYEDVGISADESDRVGTGGDPKYVVKEYPLAWGGITRADCLEIIRRLGFPPPVKSGCDFCPFQRKFEWRSLFAKRPERLDELIRFEENGRGFPKDTLMRGGPLRRLLGNGTMDDYAEPENGCDSGHCFT